MALPRLFWTLLALVPLASAEYGVDVEVEDFWGTLSVEAGEKLDILLYCIKKARLESIKRNNFPLRNMRLFPGHSKSRGRTLTR